MSRLLKFQLSKNNPVQVLVVIDEQSSGPEAASTNGDVPLASQTFEAALETVMPVIRSVFSKFQSVASDVKEMSVEFGLTMNTEAGLLIAKAGVAANFKVALVWKND